jgi:RimJ/RimL family protein N-acetyltransferase
VTDDKPDLTDHARAESPPRTVLRTPRLVLKPHTMANLARLQAWLTDPELLHFSDDLAQMRSMTQIERALLRWVRSRDPETVHLAIHRAHSDELVGYCVIAFIDTVHRRCKIGLCIGAKSEWGKGLGREVVAEVVRHCFEDLHLNRVGAEIYAFNTRSIALFEGLGFRREGVVREAVFKDGFHDEYIYGLLRSEWTP